MVLQGLQRILRPLRSEWDMEFAASGADALQVMSDRHIDVIVSDMQMPGMNGAGLLKEVQRRHPTTVRMVLSGHADRDLVAQCIGVAHQYISKPCDPEALKSLVRNACLLSGQLVEDEVKRVIGNINRLPSMPQVFTELRDAMRDEDASPRQVGAIIQKDPGMTATILKMVNSAYFGLRHTVIDPQQAVAYLGTETIKGLLLSRSLFDQAKPLQTRALTLDELWRHQMRVASGAKAIAKAEGLDAERQEEAFVGGVLHDAGVLVLASNFPADYDRVAELVATEKVQLPTAEQEIFGVTHAEVGAYLFGLWGLPSPVLKIVSLHHHPYVLGEPGMTTVTAVHAADALCGADSANPLFATGDGNVESLLKHGDATRVAVWKELVAAFDEHGGNP